MTPAVGHFRPPSPRWAWGGWVGTLIGGLVWPTIVLADACEQIRPGWDGQPVSPLSEALYLSGTLPVLLLLAGSAIAVYFRSQWGGLAAIVLWAVLTTFIIQGDDELASLATQEGCIGSPALFVTVVAAICVAIVLKTLPRPPSGTARGEDNGDT